MSIDAAAEAVGNLCPHRFYRGSLTRRVGLGPYIVVREVENRTVPTASLLPDALRVMNRFEADGDRWVLREGKRFADIVGLPDRWPPSEPK
jgi:hypothetical protein